MNTVEPFREVKDGKLTLHLHPGQSKTDDSKARFVAMLAGTQGGKTCYSPIWLQDEIRRIGGGDYLAVTANYDLFKLKFLPEFRAAFEGGVANGQAYTLNMGRYWAGERLIELAEDLIPGKFWAEKQDDPMWGRIILRSAEAEAGLESATAKAVVCDEAGHPDFKRTAWEAIQRRLSIHQGRVLFTTTLYTWGWFKHEIYDRWKAGDKDYDIIQFDSTVNPSFPREEYERARCTFPRWKFDMFYRGQWSRPAGLIYDSFDETVCKIDRFPIPLEWPRYVGHDFGPVNPAAMFYAQDLATGYFYAYQEYKPNVTHSIAQHVEEFKIMTQGMNVIKRAGGSHQEDETRQGYTAHGWPIQEPNIRGVEAGIDKVFALHARNKLFVFKDLYEYLDEKTSYSRVLDENYNPTEEIEGKDRYHLLDAERYILSDFTPETVVPGAGYRTVVSRRGPAGRHSRR